MPIAIVCPSCGSKIKAPDNAAGRRAKCPKCASPVDVPAQPPLWKEPALPLSSPAAQIDVEPLPPARLPAQLLCGHCDGAIGIDQRFAGQVVLCPHCHNQVHMPGGPPPLPIPIATVTTAVPNVVASQPSSAPGQFSSLEDDPELPGTKKRRQSRAGLWIGLGAAVLAVGGVLWLTGFFRNEGRPVVKLSHFRACQEGERVCVVGKWDGISWVDKDLAIGAKLYDLGGRMPEIPILVICSDVKAAPPKGKVIVSGYVTDRIVDHKSGLPMLLLRDCSFREWKE